MPTSGAPWRKAAHGGYNTVTGWGGRYDACANCGTTEHAKAWRGHCVRCSRYAKVLQQTESWDPSDMRTWAGYAGHLGGPRRDSGIWSDGFCSAAEYIAFVRAHCESALSTRKWIEDENRGVRPTNPVSMEAALSQVRGLLGSAPPRHATADDLRRLDEPTRQLINGWLWDWLLSARRSRFNADLWEAAHEEARSAWRDKMRVEDAAGA